MTSSTIEDVSFEDICVEVGLHKGSLYHLFPSREAAGLAVLDVNRTMMAAMLDEAFDAEVEPLVRIDRFVEGFGGMLALMCQLIGKTRGCPLDNLATETSAHDGEGRVRITRILDAWARYFTDAITEAQMRGDVHAPARSGEAAMRILAYLQGMALMAKEYDRPPTGGASAVGVRRLLQATA